MHCSILGKFEAHLALYKAEQTPEKYPFRCVSRTNVVAAMTKGQITFAIAPTTASMFRLFSAATQMRPESTP